MGLRRRLKRLQRDAEEEMLVIPQRDGTVKKFPPGAGADAYMNMMDRLGAGEDAPTEHPLIEAARNSSDPRWLNTFYAVEDPDEWVKPVEDLSEP
jgi:hypothetical protein